MDYKDKSGHIYKVSGTIGSGGEGTIYKIAGTSDYVLKIYKPEKRNTSRYKKLQTMAGAGLTASAKQQLTWPETIVYENNNFAGYLMRFVKGEELNVMYSDKYKNKTTFRAMIKIAMNLCVAINAVHNINQVCGDLNPKNIKVDPDKSTVTLVDTDSYHIYDGSHTYRCEVGLPEYLAPEIQSKLRGGVTLATANLPTFTKATDLFALAVHIFALLMNGCHPFSCAVQNTNKASVAAPQPLENIRDGFFPFYDKRAGVTIPVYAPDYNMLPQGIQNLFKKAFVDGHKNPSIRPTAEEWYNELGKMDKDLTQCSCKKIHVYPSYLKGKCPWCELERKIKSKRLSTTPSTKGTTTTPSTKGTTTTPKTTTTTSSPKTILGTSSKPPKKKKKSIDVNIRLIVTLAIVGVDILLLVVTFAVDPTFIFLLLISIVVSIFVLIEIWE